MDFEIDYLLDFTRDVVPKMVEAGLAILEPEIKKSLEHSIGKNLKYKSKSTGQLSESIDASHTFISDGGRRFKGNVYFKGKREDGFRNGEIAAYKEYGTPHRLNHDQEPSRFIKNAVSKTKRKVENVMKQVLEDELKV